MYALSKTKKVDDGEVLSASDEEELAHNINLGWSVSRPKKKVNTDLSEREEEYEETGDLLYNGSEQRQVWRRDCV